ncbi:3-isopropylmalate dehydratase large subunit [Variovorax beijingensis]|uniref:3-isopropylmalate/(R)-2-methylmalate dehydratase large subunit n=2 Tax=Variovorax TaxID=34072 RepID=A0AAE3XTL1_VARPD|nr:MULTISPECIES: 3-isopropylmalate dehydratase large subunit [Variovorax]MBD9666506.1 3-isopropylmalate dehydratase large subunit [Variovorax sp. VRV01]MDP9966454.1 3-isopropylmalate/(R)-2-methylmalate dehydratase large subunit [Variovorax paradoxus]MDR6424002.1 3-isopropylmalate/(R)-2-methylmalate dehydratase large subunit [Variovorax paradoxus]TWD87101.1 3-isopropylmalate dehydratase large subunit [Variovorax beijingensis]
MTFNASDRAPAQQTLAQKLIARASGRAQVAVGEIVTCGVDMAMFHDSSGPRRLQPMLEELGAQIWDRSRVVLVMDHYVPERDDDSRRIVRIARDWAREQQLPHVYDSQGICHVVVPQHGHIRPGMLCVGGDSHSPTGGAFGAYMFGIGSTEMLGVMVTGEIWLRVPETIRMWWDGALPAGVTAKDMMLHMIGRFGMNGGRYQAVEFAGPAVAALSMQERMTLSNMSAELGAQAGLIAPDATTAAFLAQAGAPPVDMAPWFTDEGAALTHHRFDAATLEPYVAAPHSPANAHGVSRYLGTHVDVAYIGACTGAKLDDLRAAAQVLRGHKVASGIRLIVAPASLHDQEQAREEGVLQVLMDAGAELFPTACGACSGYGDPMGDGITVISTTARNFKGRMGSPTAQVYLGSPYTVAAAALRGCVTDPREVLA